ncbi:MAG: 30S ribosomal protein S17 [Mycoplasmataceae bacterium]|jgi:small subunit ribosomal protein S17|nr:30S ribosomal protein S17 [Mycoplasmataceae bacterium]
MKKKITKKNSEKIVHEKKVSRINTRKIFQGVVVSDKMNKTIVVNVERKFSHPKLQKLVVSNKKYHTHDEKQEAKIGDKVLITETKPLSKTKFYRLVKIVEKAK